MDSKIVSTGLLLVFLGVTNAKAENGDLAEGKALYNKECSVCHGVMADTNTSAPAPLRSEPRPLHLAMAPSDGSGVADFPIPLSSEWSAIVRDRLAVVPLYGPPLKGVIGRIAGTYSGYGYSKAFLQKMDGVTWDESKLDSWIKSSQTMVSGSFMFYSQKKPDIRSKIIEYLKAH